VILADTSVWLSHYFRKKPAEATFAEHVTRGELVLHPWVYGELLLAGMIQFGIILWGQNTLNQVVRDTGRYAATLCTPSMRDTVPTRFGTLLAQAVGRSGKDSRFDTSDETKEKGEWIKVLACENCRYWRPRREYTRGTEQTPSQTEAVDNVERQMLDIEGNNDAQIRTGNNFTIATYVSGNDGHAACHGFEQNVGPPLVAGRQHEYISGRQRPTELVSRHRAKEFHGAFQLLLRHQLLKFLGPITLRAWAANNQIHEVWKLSQ